jgi:hypothetical protein
MKVQLKLTDFLAMGRFLGGIYESDFDGDGLRLFG